MPDQSRIPELNGTTTIPYDSFMTSGRWRFFDAIVTTEFWGVPWWYRSGSRVFVNHGVGPKKDYLNRLGDENFTHILVSGRAAHEEIGEALADPGTEDTELVEVGLPISDRLFEIASARPPTPAEQTPTLLYAPSWHVDPNLIGMDDDILNQLGALSGVNVIIRPHPSLFKPERCGGRDWQTSFAELENLGCEISKDRPIAEDLERADVILGDISSVIYEFLFFDKPGMLYIPEEILSKTITDISKQRLLKAFHRLSESKNLVSVMTDLLQKPDSKRKGREDLLNVTFYNVGHAAVAAESAIRDIVSKA